MEFERIFRIRSPLKRAASVSQKFGMNNLPLYKQLGLKGHNGIDIVVPDGTEVVAVADGVINFAGENPGFGVLVELISGPYFGEGGEFKMRYVYGHLLKVLVKAGDQVRRGDVLALTDNTGFSTGPHLHLGAYPYYRAVGDVWTRDIGNGYSGAIDPEPLFEDGWNDFPVDRMYGQMRNRAAELLFLARNGLYVFSRFRRLLRGRELFAFVYGSWDIETVLNPALQSLWFWCTKGDYESKKCAPEKGG